MWYIKLLSTFGALWSWLWLQSKNRTVRCNWHKKILNKNKWRLLAWTYPVTDDNEIRWQIYMRLIDSNSLADRSIKCIFICVHFILHMHAEQNDLSKQKNNNKITKLYKRCSHFSSEFFFAYIHFVRVKVIFPVFCCFSLKCISSIWLYIDSNEVVPKERINERKEQKQNNLNTWKRIARMVYKTGVQVFSILV